MDDKTEIVVYYISSKELCVQELKMYYKLLPGFIEVIFHPSCKEMTVIDIKSTYTGKEYGSHLLVHACNEAKKRGITKVILDDCSDRYRAEHNIYIKLGLTYDDCVFGPEMSGDIDFMSSRRLRNNPPVIYSLSL
jgi:GNAT superfamily N-acetyltransferase